MNVKCVVCGDGEVGKTGMLITFTTGSFPTNYIPTVFDNYSHNMAVDGVEVCLQLWDTAGQEEFDCITRAYYRGAQACVLAFSCVDRESFKCVPKWKKKVEEECGNIPMVLVMTKLDLLYRAEVDSFEVEKLSRQLGIRLIKTSVKENINVHKVKCQVNVRY